MKLGPGLELPLDVATEAMGILATRGAGKSYTSAVLIEELHDAGIQTVVLDPAGVYWGLTSSANGKKAGLPFYVFGGQHADVELNPAKGAWMADLIVDSGHSFVLDFSGFETKADMVRFVTAFAERLYYRKAESRTPLHVVIDEADDVAPQKPQRDETRMLHNVERLVKRGRSRGIGLTLISQRSQAINKSVLDLIETLVVLRMLSPRSVDAVKAWITAKDLRDELGVTESLPSLATGTAWIWSPLRATLKKVNVRRIRTFDSYATPKPGEVRTEPQQRAKLDLEALGGEMRASAERAKENDPQELRGRVRELERKVAEFKAAEADLAERLTAIDEAHGESAVEEVLAVYMEARKHVGYSVDLVDEVRALADRPAEQVEVPAITDAQLLELVTAVNEIRMATNPIAEALQIVADVKIQARERKGEPEQRERRGSPVADTSREVAPRAPRQRRAPAESSNGDLGGGAPFKMLQVLATFPEGRTKNQLAVLSGYSGKSSTFRNGLSRLRSRGYAEGSKLITITAAGRDAVGDVEELPRGEELYRYWRQQLGDGAPSRMLDVLYGSYPQALDKQTLGARAGYSIDSSTFRNGLSRLRSLELAHGSAEIKASDVFFE